MRIEPIRRQSPPAFSLQTQSLPYEQAELLLPLSLQLTCARIGSAEDRTRPGRGPLPLKGGGREGVGSASPRPLNCHQAPSPQSSGRSNLDRTDLALRRMDPGPNRRLHRPPPVLPLSGGGTLW